MSKTYEGTYGYEVEQNTAGAWVVTLPHNCDRWAIAGGDGWGDFEGVTQAEAIADLEQFIAEATEALESLRAGQPYPPQEDAG